MRDPSISDPFIFFHMCLSRFPSLHIEDFLQLLHRILRALHRMPCCPFILVDLPVVAALVRLVAEEVYRSVLDPGQVLLGLEML